MFSYRICKYDPQCREKNGTYKKEEWTDFSDIGNTFCDKVLTNAEYSRVENNYISCIMSIMEKSSLFALRIEDLEKYSQVAWENGGIISLDTLSHVCRDCLRNNCWCKLSGEEFYIHFGYDYYMYVGCLLSLSEVSLICSSNNLFCELMDSPYN